jgi:hypothetical protein
MNTFDVKWYEWIIVRALILSAVVLVHEGYKVGYHGNLKVSKALIFWIVDKP